jgi:hypothetical protein
LVIPPDNFKISNHETIQRPYQYKHYPLHERSVQDSFAQMMADAEEEDATSLAVLPADKPDR